MRNQAFSVAIMSGVFLLAMGGCYWPRAARSDGGSYSTVAQDPHRDTQTARQYNALGAQLLNEDNLPEAEKQFKEALKADVFYGPAHSNLGNVYFQQTKYYLAAWEFQYAIKLMPDKAEPRNNLGMVYEAAGKVDDAIKQFEEAHQIEPEKIEITANLAKARLRANLKDEKTRKLLNDVLIKDNRPDWIKWARQSMLTVRCAPTPASQPTSAASAPASRIAATGPNPTSRPSGQTAPARVTGGGG